MNGYFEAWANGIRENISADDRQLMATINKELQDPLRGSARWAGSQAKSTAIVGSDLDMCVITPEPVTEAQRRQLMSALQVRLNRPAHIRSHVVRLDAHGEAPKVDLAFANAAFGSRPLPDASEFQGKNARQQAARALKFWARSGGLPEVGGWAMEKMVVHLDARAHEHGLDLMVDVLKWLDERANPGAIEGILRPFALPKWQPVWSQKLPGRLEALKNAARALRRRYRPGAWCSTADVEQWIRPR